MLNNINPLIDALRAKRKAMKLSQQKLAEKVGIPQSHISKIEAGDVNIKLASFVEMARAVDLEVMLVPRKDIMMVKGLIASKETKQGGEGESTATPAYSLDQGDDDNDSNDHRA